MNLRPSLLLAAALIAGCGVSASDTSGVGADENANGNANATSGVGANARSERPTTTTASQAAAFSALEASTHQAWRWLDEPSLKTPMHLSAVSRGAGAPILRRGDNAAARSIAFLEENKALYRMKSAAAELSLTTSRVDALGMTHTRFQQSVHGVPVASREIFLHYDPAGRLTSIDADYVPDLDDVDVTPRLASADALAQARVGLGVSASATFSTDSSRLVVYAPEGRPTAKLAYEYRVRSTDETGKLSIWKTTVDAATGAILHRYDDLQTIQGSGLGILGTQETFQVSQSSTGNGFFMSDTSNGVEITTLTAKNKQVAPGGQISSTSATSWDTTGTGAGAAVDAHVNAERVYKYYKDHHARNAIDGAGGAMLSTVHYGSGYDNAAWDGTGMLYGDGSDFFIPLSLALDVVGHEFTHGVTGATSNLDYETQSGALNEAISDIFGCMIEHVSEPDPVKNWTIAESIVKSGGPLRDMTKPESVSDPQPGHMSEFVQTQEDNGGVHTNSGIINNAGWLMTVGGTNPVSNVAVKFGIGWEKAEKIWYRANTTYFKQTTNFGQAAQGVLQAATDLSLTANEIAIVDCAFKAVGIAQGDCSPITDPTVAATSPTAAGAGADTPSAASGGTATATGGPDAPATAETAAPTIHKRAVTVKETTCSVTAVTGRDGSRNLAPFAVALGMLWMLRRRRKRP